LTGDECLVELAIKKMFMKESIKLSLTDADDFTIDFEHVLALANSCDFNFWFHRIAASFVMDAKNILKSEGGHLGAGPNLSGLATNRELGQFCGRIRTRDFDSMLVEIARDLKA
jgi:hypothetical protein